MTNKARKLLEGMSNKDLQPSSTLIWAKQITDARLAAFYFLTSQVMPRCFERWSEGLTVFRLFCSTRWGGPRTGGAFSHPVLPQGAAVS